MCGINGLNWQDEKLIRKMNKCLEHRGPDDQGILVKDAVSLGQTRLSILDLSRAGRQPMTYRRAGKEYAIVFNGEVYNFQELRSELEAKGHRFKTKTDTEVILASYDEYGEECVNRFNGMWAFCIHDPRQGTLFLSRDRFGQKPLYYHSSEELFVFSSEIRGIHAAGIRKEMDEEAVREVFAYRMTNDDKTCFAGIKHVQAAHNMIVDVKTGSIIKYKKYYQPNIKPLRISLREAKKRLRKTLEDSVRLRMIADVPVATLLSGGIDSSSITFLARKHNPQLNTFSIGFDTTNELPYARQAAKHLKTKHHEYKIDKDSSLDYLELMVKHMDEPIGADPGFLPILVLSEQVKKHNKVVLSGDGADEILTGYDRYKFLRYGKLLRYLPIPGKDQIAKRLRKLRGKSDQEMIIEALRVFDDEDFKKLKMKRPRKPRVARKKNIVDTAQHYDLSQLLPKDFFMKADKMSSAYGLEQRSPFMDYRIVELSLSLSLRHRLMLWQEKRVLKEAFKEDLPQDIIRRKKHGFNIPIDQWFEHRLGEKLLETMDKHDHNLYDKEYVKELLAQMRKESGGFKAKNIHAQKLWTVLIFETWYEQHFGGSR